MKAAAPSRENTDREGASRLRKSVKMYSNDKQNETAVSGHNHISLVRLPGDIGESSIVATIEGAVAGGNHELVGLTDFES